jgi:hypothetical protein
MTVRPHDIVDLYLSPLTLELDHRLRQLEDLSEAEIQFKVALETDCEPRVPEERPSLVLRMLAHNLDRHGWEMEWAPRGLRLSHDDHQLVLGVPDSVRSYLGPLPASRA